MTVYSGEVEVVSRALNHARQLALGRLVEEAERVAGYAVVGVHVTRRQHDWGNDLIEFTALGTAVHDRADPHSPRPSLTNLSGQDFWKLTQSGYWPVGLVGASAMYYVVAASQTQRAKFRWTGRANQELKDFTGGLYTARHIVMNAVCGQAKRLGARGIVGMQIEHEVEEHYDEEYYMLITFHAIGTAITQATKRAAVPAISSILSLKS